MILHACRKIDKESSAIPQTGEDLSAIRVNFLRPAG
jgi:hypothetical protein